MFTDAPGTISTLELHALRRRSTAFGAAALLSPIAIASGVTALTGSRRHGLVAGGIIGVAALALRWQMQRWFTREPAYTVERRIGDLELRRYAPRVELHTRVASLDIEGALGSGFRRLADYLFGNKLEMMTPVIARPRATTHTVAFVMPPHRTIDVLPPPADARLHLVEVPAQHLAVLRFRGSYTNETLQPQMTRLHDLVADARLHTTGEPIVAAYDPPSTLPPLRRLELWVEIASE